MSNVLLNNPKRLGNDLQVKVARMAEKQARMADFGFPIDDKIWCELTYSSILIQSLQALELLSESEQQNILNIYNNLMNK